MSGVLGNRLVGILHGAAPPSPYNEHTAWAHRMPGDGLATWRHGAGKTPVNRPSVDRWPANYGL